MTVCICLFSLLEVAAYFLYLNKVTAVKSNDLILKQMFQFHPWVKIVVKHSDTPVPQDVTSNSSDADLISQQDRLTLDSQDVAVTENSDTDAPMTSLPITMHQLMALEAQLRMERRERVKLVTLVEKLQGENVNPTETETKINEEEEIDEAKKGRTSFYSFSMYQYL